jgi:excisionase family DNA binding protein
MSKYLSPTQIAERLGVSRAKVYRILHNLPRITLGKRCVRVLETDLDEYLANNARRPTWPSSTDDTKTETGTATTAHPKDAESSAAYGRKTRRSPANDSDLPNWAQRPLRVAKSKG